jgi:hypothetical protein
MAFNDFDLDEQFLNDPLLRFTILKDKFMLGGQWVWND